MQSAKERTGERTTLTKESNVQIKASEWSDHRKRETNVKVKQHKRATTRTTKRTSKGTKIKGLSCPPAKANKQTNKQTTEKSRINARKDVCN